MRGPLALLIGGFVLSVIGTATATDAISLREVCRNIPVLCGLVTELRLGMGTTLAHALEPGLGVLGGGVMLVALYASPPRVAAARLHCLLTRSV